MPMPDQSFNTPMTNQTQIPIGDDDDDIEEYPDPDEELIETHNPLSCQLLQQSEKSNKFLALYEDAQQRNLRQENIYSKCIDKECTFQPQLVTKFSKISIQTLKKVKKANRSKSREIEPSQIPTANSVSHCQSKITYFSNREEDGNLMAPEIMDRPSEKKVFDRLSKQAKAHQDMHQFKIQQYHNNSLYDTESGNALFKP